MNKKNMDNTIFEILKKEFVLDSSKLIEKLSVNAKDKKENNKIRQRLSRLNKSKEEISCFNKINLTRNRKIYFLQCNFMKNNFLEKLIKLLLNNNSVYGIALHALYKHNGVLDINSFNIKCGCPIEKLKGHISIDSLKKNLLDEKLIIEKENLVILNHPVFFKKDLNLHLYKKSLFINIISFYLQKFNLVGYNSIRTKFKNNNDNNHIYNFYWDITAISYIYSLTDIKSKQGHVVCDYIDKVNSIDDIRGYIKKVEIVKNSFKYKNILFFIFSYYFNKDCFHKLKEIGASPVAFYQLFNDDFDIANLESLYKLLEINNGLFGNLKGSLLEIIYYNYKKAQYNSNLYFSQNKEIKRKDDSILEIDLYVTNNDNFILYGEVKAKTKLCKEDLEQFEKIINYVKYHKKENHCEYQNKEVIIELFFLGTQKEEKESKEIELQKKYKNTNFNITIINHENILNDLQEIKEQTKNTTLNSLEKQIKNFIKINTKFLENQNTIKKYFE